MIKALKKSVVYYRVLSNDSLRPNELSHRLNTNHPELKERNIEFFKRLEMNNKCKDSTEQVAFNILMSNLLKLLLLLAKQ